MELLVVLFGLIVIFLSLSNKDTYYSKSELELINSVTSVNRGNSAEIDLILKLLYNKISPKAIFHDLYIRKRDSKFSQVDLVIATPVGIIVCEVKDYSGWIYGNGKQRKWMQVLNYGNEKNRFYNPIMQNNSHVIEIKKLLKQFNNIPFYSVIVFSGDCELKDISFIPEGTYVTKSYRFIDVINDILNLNHLAEYTDKKAIIKVLKDCVKNGELENIEKIHVNNINNMLGKDRLFD